MGSFKKNIFSSVFAGDPGLQSGEEGEKIESPATPDSADQISKTDEPGEAKRVSILAKTGHKEGPRTLVRGAPLFLAAAMIQLYGCAAVEYKTPPEAVEPPQGIYHKVQPKETLWRIAKMYDVDIEDVIRYNNIPNAARIEKDQLIFIPGAKQLKETEPATAKSNVRGNDFDWPVKGEVALYFGEQRDGSANNGVDIHTSAGESVRASRDGRVVFADYLSGYGHTVILDHADGYFTVYAQNATLMVKLGDSVGQGALIARVGERDRRTSLHFEIRKNSQPVNPLYYLP